MRTGVGIGTTVALAIAMAVAVQGGGGFSGTCLVSNRADWGPVYDIGECDYGGTVSQTDSGWTCSAALSTYGALPLRVVITSTTVWAGAHAVRLQGGCTGDGDDDTIDLIIEANGDGSTVGIAGDVLKFAPFGAQGPSGVQLTIRGDCGDPGGHFDFFQNQATNANGSLMAIVNGASGDYEGGEPTCQAAGGMYFWSETGDVTLLGGEVIGCNHGLNGNAAGSGSGSVVTDLKVRVGKVGPAESNCPGVVTTNPCINTTGMTITGGEFQKWNAAAQEFLDDPCTP